MGLDSRIEKDIESNICDSLDILNDLLGYKRNNSKGISKAILDLSLTAYEAILNEDVHVTNMNRKVTDHINVIKSKMTNPEAIFTDRNLKAQVLNNISYSKRIVKSTIEKEADRIRDFYMRNVDVRNDVDHLTGRFNNMSTRVDNIERSMTTKSRIKHSEECDHMMTNYKTSSNFMTVRRSDADERYNNSCNKEMKKGRTATAIGIAFVGAGCFMGGPIGAATAKGVLIVGGGVLSFLGFGTTTHGYLARKVGEDGHYKDLFKMAQNTFGYGYAGKELMKNLSVKINNNIISHLQEGVESASDNVECKRQIIGLTRSFLECDALYATESKKFNVCISNILGLIHDLQELHKLTHSDKINMGGMRFLTDADFAKHFVNLTDNNQKEFMDSTRQIIINLMEEIQETVKGNMSINNFAVSAKKTSVESCQIL